MCQCSGIHCGGSGHVCMQSQSVYTLPCSCQPAMWTMNNAWDSIMLSHITDTPHLLISHAAHFHPESMFTCNPSQHTVYFASSQARRWSMNNTWDNTVLSHTTDTPHLLILHSTHFHPESMSACNPSQHTVYFASCQIIRWSINITQDSIMLSHNTNTSCWKLH